MEFVYVMKDFSVLTVLRRNVTIIVQMSVSVLRESAFVNKDLLENFVKLKHVQRHVMAKEYVKMESVNVRKDGEEMTAVEELCSMEVVTPIISVYVNLDGQVKIARYQLAQIIVVVKEFA